MLSLGDREVQLCLLDTNAVSEMVKRPDPVLGNFLSWALGAEPSFLPCFSPFTLIELRHRPTLFAAFVEAFHYLPCVLLKGYDQLLEEEVSLYPDPSTIDVCAIAFTPFGGPGNLLRNLPGILDDPTLRARERYWNDVREEIVGGIVELVPNFPAASSAYKPSETRLFLEMAGYTQLVLRERAFVERMAEQEKAVLIDAFPSLKASLYTVFHKFYVDASRRPLTSDAFDIIIAASTPYVEAIITENHQAEALSKVQRLDGFIEDLLILRLSDFEGSAPNPP